jgi:hypothetical protein
MIWRCVANVRVRVRACAVVTQIVNNFVSMAKSRSQFYRHNKLLIPFGDDFAHREAYVRRPLIV